MSIWDELDRMAAEALKKSPPTLAAEGEDPETGKTISRDRMRTMQAEARIRAGFHPFGMGLARNGETCATCAHLRAKEYAKTYFKCAKRGDTKGPATDVRKKWPACFFWEPKP